jgi:hypothetical protein
MTPESMKQRGVKGLQGLKPEFLLAAVWHD